MPNKKCSKGWAKRSLARKRVTRAKKTQRRIELGRGASGVVPHGCFCLCGGDETRHGQIKEAQKQMAQLGQRIMALRVTRVIPNHTCDAFAEEFGFAGWLCTVCGAQI